MKSTRTNWKTFGFWLLVCAAAAPGLPADEPQSADRTAQEFLDRYHRALLANDIAVLNETTAEDAVITTTEGVVQTREEWIEPIQSGAVKVAALEATDRKTRELGGTLVTNYRAEIRLVAGELSLNVPCRVTLVLVQRNGAWCIAASNCVVITK